MEWYFEVTTLTDEAVKVHTVTLYLIDMITLWWRQRYVDIEKGACIIDK